MTKKKILLVHNFYQIGGGEHTVFENEKNLLLESGHEVITYTRSNDELKTSKRKLLMMPFTTSWSWKTFFEVKRIICENGIDIVHCHNTFPLISPSVYYAARSLEIPVVQTIHNFRFLCPNGLFYCDGKICEQCRAKKTFIPALKHGCYRNSKIQTAVVTMMLTLHRWLGTYQKINYIFLTEFNKRKFSELIDISGENVFVKPNFAKKLGTQKTETPAGSKFLFIGRLDENKGIDFLLHTWPLLPEHYELHIYGDGKYEAECREKASLYKNIQYLGFRPREEIADDLADATALLFPSTVYETFGMTWVESFSMGRPVVASDLGNHGELVRLAKGGALYEVGNKDSFAHALQDVIANNTEYSGNAVAFYNEFLTETTNYEKLSEIYDKAKHIR